MLNGEVIGEAFDISDYEGFVYCINYTDGTKYIGKKNFWSTFEKETLKRDGVKRDGHLEFVGRRRGGKNVKRERFRKEMNWRKYNGSSSYTDGKQIESKEILKLCSSKLDLTYWETYYLMEAKVLFDDIYLNCNILGKFYAGQLTDSKEYIKD